MSGRQAAVLWVPVTLTVLACARIEAPSGGPEDDTPPVLVSIDPEPGPGHPDLRRIVLRYDERLGESTAELALYPALESVTAVSGKSITIELAEPLSSGVLVVHVPATLSDAHGNQTGTACEMAWGGADTLPSSAILMSFTRQAGGVPSGRVIADVEARDGSLVRRTSADSTYSAVAGWLGPGEYAVTAYEDPDYSFTWESEAEAGADTVVQLGSGDTLHLSMVLSVVDTVGPRLSDAQIVDMHHLVVTFSEQVRLPAQDLLPFRLRDTTGTPVPVLGAWKTGARDQRSLVLATGRTGAGRFVLVEEGMIDMMGNEGLPDSLELEGSDSLSTDTLRIRSTYPAPGAVDVPPAGPFSFSFSDWVDPDSVASHLSLVRITDLSKVPVELGMDDGRSFLFSPLTEMTGEEQYRISLDSGLVDLQGNAMPAQSWSFVPAWGSEPGSLEGHISGGREVVLQVAPAGQSGGALLFSVPGSGTYSAGPVPAGRYTVTAYGDLNGNGIWDGAAGEPYGAAPGVVLVRPGLVTTGVDIEVLP